MFKLSVLAQCAHCKTAVKDGTCRGHCGADTTWLVECTAAVDDGTTDANVQCRGEDVYRLLRATEEEAHEVEMGARRLGRQQWRRSDQREAAVPPDPAVAKLHEMASARCIARRVTM